VLILLTYVRMTDTCCVLCKRFVLIADGSVVDIPYRLDIFEDRLYVLMNDRRRVLVMNKFRNVDQPGQILLNETSQTPITHLLLVQQYRKKGESAICSWSLQLAAPCHSFEQLLQVIDWMIVSIFLLY